MLRTNWIFKQTETFDEPNDMFLLVKTLVTQNSDSLYQTEFVRVLIDEFWDLYQTSIFLFIFLPFFTYAASVIFYFSYYFLDSTEENEQLGTSKMEKTLKVMIYVLNIYIASFEVVQLYDLKSSYFSDFTNWVDMISTTLILFIMTSNDFFGGKTLWKE